MHYLLWMRNYYGFIPSPVRDSRILSAQAKVLYAEITSRTDCNNHCEICVREFTELYDTDEDGVERWILLLAKEKFLYAEKIIEEKKVCWRIALLFPERKIAPEVSSLQEKAAAHEKPKQEITIELTPEQILRKHYDITEIQKAFPALDIAGLEAPIWSAKLILKYGKQKVLKDPKQLYEHFIKWISKSRNTNSSSDILEVLS